MTTKDKLDRNKTLEFIEDYRKYEVLWDHKHKEYTNNVKRNNALTAMGIKYDFDVKMVKNKIKSLRSYFSREHQKVLTGESYQSSWFAYKSLLFILDSITSRESGENTSEDVSNDYSEVEDEDDSNSRYSENEHEFEFVQPTRTKRSNKTSRDDKEVNKKLKMDANRISEKDECTIFGQLMAHKLRKLNPRNRLLAEHRINNILFDLELGELGEMDTGIIKFNDNYN